MRSRRVGEDRGGAGHSGQQPGERAAEPDGEQSDGYQSRDLAGSFRQQRPKHERAMRPVEVGGDGARRTEGRDSQVASPVGTLACGNC